MIDFRYHVVSLVAAFLALTVGIVLGGSLFNQPLIDRLGQEREQLAEARDGLRARIGDLRRDSAYHEAFVSGLAPTLVEGKLEGQTAVVVALPGAGQELTEALRETLRQAGADISGSLALTGRYVDDSRAGLLDGLVSRLVPAGLTLPEGTPQQRAAAELAHAVTTKAADDVGKATPERSAILAGLEEAGFVHVEGEPARGATLAAVVAPPGPLQGGRPDESGAGSGVEVGGADSAVARYNDALVALVGALDDAGRGAVLAGPEGAALEDGVVRAVRADPAVGGRTSTVDVAQRASGRVTVVRALAAELQGRSGHYGMAEGAERPLP
ncbi:MAG: copper transporter [Carbonactinosporaceae bacterium]